MGMERSCLGEDTRKEEARGAGLGELFCRGQGSAGGQGTRQESWSARGREQRAITWWGGQAQIGIRDALFHLSLDLSHCSPQGKQQPPPSPLWQSGVTRNGKCHFLVGSPEAPPGSQPWGRGGVSQCCHRPGRGGAPARVAHRSSHLEGILHPCLRDSKRWGRGASAVLGSQVETAPPCPDPSVLSRSIHPRDCAGNLGILGELDSGSCLRTQSPHSQSSKGTACLLGCGFCCPFCMGLQLHLTLGKRGGGEGRGLGCSFPSLSIEGCRDGHPCHALGAGRGHTPIPQPLRGWSCPGLPAPHLSSRAGPGRGCLRADQDSLRRVTMAGEGG